LKDDSGNDVTLNAGTKADTFTGGVDATASATGTYMSTDGSTFVDEATGVTFTIDNVLQ
jgi:hypothetical protein